MSHAGTEDKELQFKELLFISNNYNPHNYVF